ncbi:MAG: hypothetical protein ISP91_00090 [Pseudomonadales bacterium]|nr:hypothetical protein [Pseudomonadales bacterium]
MNYFALTFSLHPFRIVAMTPEEINDVFSPAMDEIINRCRLTDEFVDKEKFQVLVATVWSNAVLDPPRSGLTESDLPALHDFLNGYVEELVGPGETITSCFEFITSRQGEESLTRQNITANHKEFLHYFAKLIFHTTAEGFQDVTRLPD